MELKLCRIIVDHAHDRFCDDYSPEKQEHLIIATSLEEVLKKVISKTSKYSWTEDFRNNPVLNKKSIEQIFDENNLVAALSETGRFDCLVPVYHQSEIEDDYFDEENYRLRDKLLIDVSILDSTDFV